MVSASNTLVLGNNVNVGIGTSNPTKGKLEITGSVSSFLGYGFLDNLGNTGVSGGVNDYSIYADNRIAASEFNAHSDARIKQIKDISDGAEDLNILMDIEIRDYTMIDTLAKGHRNYKKVIAQQVAEVYPQAVTNDIKEVIPDIYQRAEVKNGWIMMNTDLEIGERVKIITENSNEIYNVIEAELTRFKVAFENSEFNDQKVFVYGREVHDFHTVDYGAIAMLNVSATQELANRVGGQQRIIEKQQEIIQTLKAENADMKSKMERVETMENDITELKEIILRTESVASKARAN